MQLDAFFRAADRFDAPRALVFDCHTQPELVRRWLLGPPGWTMPVCEIDFHGEFREIAAPERVVHTEYVDGAGEEAGHALCTLVLDEADGRTILTQTMRFPAREIRDQALQSGMADGMEASYVRLQEVMAEQAVA